MLYLTDLRTSSAGASGRWLRNRLALLDLAARLDGLQPWTERPDVKRYINGLHDTHPLGRPERSDPLYRENVAAMMEATSISSPVQVRDQVALLLAHDTHLSTQALADLRWDLVHLTRATASISPAPFPSGAQRTGPPLRLTCTTPHTACTVHALHALRRLTGRRTGPVLASPWGAADLGRLKALTRKLRGHACTAIPVHACEVRTQALTAARNPTATATRDRALLSLSFTAALRGQEASALLTDQIHRRDDGLLLLIPSRRESTWISIADDMLGTANAWTAWLDRRATEGVEARLALLPVYGTIWDQPMGRMSLNKAVQRCADQAGLRGSFTFTSLRMGLIRTLLREGTSPHIVAGRADMRTLSGVERHAARENVLRDNVAARLGL
jgi:site-specific recombinase XerD